MAVQNLIEQHIIFITSTSDIDERSILANSLVQSLANNSVGNDLIINYRHYYHWDGTSCVGSGFYEITCFVTAAFQTTIQNNIPNLQTAFPQYTIVTWGHSVSFGN